MSGRARRTGAWLRGWRLPLRLAGREARRAGARSLLVVVLVALPVLGVTLADVLVTTSRVSSQESLPRRIGDAQAGLVLTSSRLLQAPDPESRSVTLRPVEPSSLDDALAAIGEPAAPHVALRTGPLRFRTPAGVAEGTGLQGDLADPLAAGLVDLGAGRLPRGPTEVVVNQAAIDRGVRLGGVLELDDGARRTVVGVGEAGNAVATPVVAGAGDLVPAAGSSTTYLVGGSPVSWTDVGRLNRIGVQVLSRAVVEDPPAPDLVPAAVQPLPRTRETLSAVALVAAMVLIEVVLLAGPAFAVGARRQARSLALIAAAGGSPRDARRVVLAGAVVLGTAATLLGTALGVLGARLVLPAVQSRVADRFGPFEVVWTQVLPVAALGLASAAIAAAAPAWSASRQDVVAVLAGRRGDPAPSRRTPVLGLLLLAAGVAGSAWGARPGASILLTGLAAIVCVLGMVLLVPVVVAGVARVATRLPLSLRLAARDASRHGARTAPAVAAVAATVAGVVSLGIALASTSTAAEAEYAPTAPRGEGLVSAAPADTTGAPTAAATPTDADWVAAATAVRRAAPDVDVQPVTGVASPAGGGGQRLDVDLAESGVVLGRYSTPAGDYLVAGSGLPPLLDGTLAPGDVARAERTLAAGGAVFLTDQPSPAGGVPPRVRVSLDRYGPDGRTDQRERARLPFALLRVSAPPPAQAVLSPAAARALDLTPRTTALLVGRGLTTQAQQQADQALAAVPGGFSLYVERGPQVRSAVRVVQLVLTALAGTLMLGGTLTATFLALADARPDLATLGAVGAGPGVRRRVAAAYAVVVALTGAVLGIVVGLVPGVAISLSLVATGTGPTSGLSSLTMPWGLLLAVLVGLPLLTAGLVWATAGSRLPMAARTG